MKCLLVAGGEVDIKQLDEIYSSIDDLYVIGADRGGLILYENDIRIDRLIGDFDSLSEEEKKAVFDYVTDQTIEQLIPEKDDTDAEHALRYALSLNPEEIIMLGCTGTRMDHTLACIRMLKLAADAGVRACILDKHNRISGVKGSVLFSKENQFGKYISFFPYNDSAVVSMKGFKYEVEDFSLTADVSRGVSNELMDEECKVSIKNNDYIIVMETRD